MERNHIHDMTNSTILLAITNHKSNYLF